MIKQATVEEVIQENLSTNLLDQYNKISNRGCVDPEEDVREGEEIIGQMGLTMQKLYTLYRLKFNSSHAGQLAVLFWSLLRGEMAAHSGAIALRKGFKVVIEK